jgi:hypothetical protein
MRTWWAGILIVLAALVAAPAAWGQEQTATPTPSATPTPDPTPTPEEIEEAERKEQLRRRKIVRRVYQDYQRDGRIDNCEHSRTALKRTLESITDEFDTDFPDFREAVKAAIEDHDTTRCEEEAEEAEPTPTPSPSRPSPSTPSPTPAPTTTPAPSTPPSSTDSGDVPDLGVGGGGGGGGGGGDASPPPADTPAPPAENDVTPVQPEATPAPTAVPPPAEPQLAVVRPDGDRNQLLPALLLAIALAGLGLLGASALAARRSERLAGWGHAWREAAYRATGAWGDFGDWLRLGR